jgi:hypothetical protein
LIFAFERRFDMKGRRNKGIMIMPTSADDLAKAQHWLMARDLEFKEFEMPTADGEMQSVLITEFGLADRLLYRLTFRDRNEKVSVYC